MEPGDRTPPSDEALTRRVCAVLLADVTGFSALMGQDDERTAHAVRSLQDLVRRIAAENRGHAEGFAGDAIFASFDSVLAAVEAALTIQRHLLRETFEGLHLKIRIGVHYGDVLFRDGRALGDAVNIALRLQARARPGTVCISDDVYHQVHSRFDEKFVDLGRQHFKNLAAPVHAYLIVPRELEAQQARVAWRTLVASTLGTAVLAVLVTLAAMTAIRYWNRPGEEPFPPRVPSGATLPRRRAAVPAGETTPHLTGQVALGVMLFKGLGGEGEQEWRREALRDGLNAQLSQLSGVKVYSKEFIDFLMSRKGLTDVEAASELGIKKMLSGSFVVVKGRVRVETHIVDVETGVLEASYTTAGDEKDFLNVQNQLAQGVITHLKLPITADEKRLLLAQQTTDVEGLKLLLEAEAGGAAPAQPGPGPGSALQRWLAGAAQPSAASAAETPAHEADINALLERYRQATEAREPQALAAIYTEFPPEQQAAQQRYFDNVRDLRVTITNVDAAVVGDEAVVSYTRIDDFVDARTGRPMHVAVRLTKILRKVNDEWKVTGGK